jgi:hypothetical protein
MVTRAVRGLGIIVPSYSTLWAAVGALAWPVTVLGYAEAYGLHLEWLGTVWPPWHVRVRRPRVYFHKICWARRKTPFAGRMARGQFPWGQARWKVRSRGRLSRDPLS